MSSYLLVREKTRESDKAERVPEALDGAALDAVVRATFDLSWGRARDLVRRGKVSVDGRTVTDPVRRVKKGASVVLDLAAKNTRTLRSELSEAAIVHLDAHLVVVEKPAGIATIPFDPEGMGASIARRARVRAPDEEATLDERVRLAIARREKKGGPPPELGVVHRLDKETSGLLVFTRTWAAKKALMQAFRTHTIHRRYLAIVHGDMRAAKLETHFVENRGDGLRGSIEHRGGRKHAVGSERGQLAITHVDVVERLPGGAVGACTLIGCELETGRTHQIRIHVSEVGHPVVGDRVYTRGYRGTVVPAPRLMLHAAELGFLHPATGRELRFRSDPPADMQGMLASLRG